MYPRAVRQNSSNTADEIIIPDEVTHVTIYITGAVEKPGVYTLASNSRVKQAIEAAGGAKPNWDAEGVNLAKKLNDEDMILIPFRSQTLRQTADSVKPKSSGPFKKQPPPNGLSLNRASLAELETLPGVGPGMAQRIVAYRQSHGGFNSIEEIRHIPGMGKKKIEKIKPYLRL